MFWHFDNVQLKLPQSYNIELKERGKKDMSPFNWLIILYIPA